MAPWRPGAWQRVAALAPLLLLLVSLPSQVLMRCQMDGQVRESCCCPRGESAPAEETAVTGASCCSSVTSVRHLPEVRTTSLPEATPALIALALPEPAPRPDASLRALRPAAPARDGPPLLLLKQAFLI